MPFHMTAADMRARSCTDTACEIYQQPTTWQRTFAQMEALLPSLRPWLAQITAQPDFDVIFTGAGTSEYVGNALCPAVNPSFGYHARSFGTTDLVAAPAYYLSPEKPTLLVSFARSGNSPESVGAVAAADAYCHNLQHLFITCNKDGALAKLAADRENCRAILLADETDDRSFAMTSSFTNMYLAALCAFSHDLTPLRAALDAITAQGQAFLDSGFEALSSLMSVTPFQRIVYLGTGPLKGIAQESALKMLELTAGSIPALFDTPMGFRHGPKSIVHDDTLTVLYLSDQPDTRRYEMDLLRELSGQRKGNKLLVVSGQPDSEAAALCDCFIAFDNPAPLPAVALGLEMILSAQCLALFKSLSLGVTPDNPCPTGEVNRVVKGVTIYPVK